MQNAYRHAVHQSAAIGISEDGLARVGPEDVRHKQKIFLIQRHKKTNNFL